MDRQGLEAVRGACFQSFPCVRGVGREGLRSFFVGGLTLHGIFGTVPAAWHPSVSDASVLAKLVVMPVEL